jgi:hypothetical protein
MFTVNHFNGPVTYSSEGFLERDLDALNPDYVSLLRGAADGSEALTLSSKASFQPKLSLHRPTPRMKTLLLQHSRPSSLCACLQ